MPSERNPVERFSKYFRHADTEPVEALCDSTRDRPIEIDWQHLAEVDRSLAELLSRYPDAAIGYADAALYTLGCQYTADRNGVEIRVGHLGSSTPIAECTRADVGRLVECTGTVEASTSIYPKAFLVTLECRRCETGLQYRTIGPSRQFPNRCPECGAEGTLTWVKDGMECSDARIIRLGSLPSVSSDRTGRISVYLEGSLNGEVSLGTDVAVTGVIRPVDTESIDPLVSIDSLIVDTTDVRRLDASVTDPIPDVERGADRDEAIRTWRRDASPPPFEALIASVAPSITGWHRAKTAFLLHYALGHTGGSDLPNGCNVLFVPPDDVDPSPLFRSIRSRFSDVVYTDVDGCTGPVVPEIVKKGSDRYWIEAGRVACAGNRPLIVDSLDLLTDLEQRRLGIALDGDNITVHKAGFTVKMTPPDGFIAVMTPRALEESPCRITGDQLAESLRESFDLVVTDGPSEGPQVKRLAEVIDWRDSATQNRRAESEDAFEQRMRMKRYQSYIRYVRSRDVPSVPSELNTATLRSSDETLQAETATPSNDGTDTVALIAAAITKLRLGDAVIPEDVSRARRLLELF
jgi:DNA replicative helicase MCM subunit Mcm2 (Cdc46/Mcm family)